MAILSDMASTDASTPPAHSKMWLWRTELSSAAGSAVSTAVMFPLDSIKSRMQTFQYKGIMDCVKQSYAREGVAGFFRGTMSPMVTITVARTTSLSIYTNTKHAIARAIEAHTGFNVYQHLQNNSYPHIYTLGCFGIAGLASGTALSVLACPFELSKICTQVSVQLLADPRFKDDAVRRRIAESYQQKGPFRCMGAIWKNRGFFGLFTGLNMHLARDICGTIVYFSVYESFKQMGKRMTGDSYILDKLSILGSGGLSGAISWIMIYPIDSSKTIYQKNALCFLKGEKVPSRPKVTYLAKSGYRGLIVSMARSFLSNGIFFSLFEFTKNWIKTVEGERTSHDDEVAK